MEVRAKGGWTSRAGFSLEIKFQWCIVQWAGMKHPNLIEPGDKTRDSLALLGLGTNGAAINQMMQNHLLKA